MEKSLTLEEVVKQTHEDPNGGLMAVISIQGKSKYFRLPFNEKAELTESFIDDVFHNACSTIKSAYGLFDKRRNKCLESI